MFTSGPSLAQRIERIIGDTPIVDPYSRIRVDRPNAPDLAALMGDRRVEAGLIASGMPAGDLDPTLPPDERVRRSIPYLGRMRNTAAAWCLFRIFRDLYDFDEPNLTEANYRGLFDKVAGSGKDPGWARVVLREKSNVKAIVTGLVAGPAENPGGTQPFDYRLEFPPSLFPGSSSGGSPKLADYLQALEAFLGERPATSGHLERLVFDRLDRAISGRVRFTSISLPAKHRFRPPDASAARSILDRACIGMVEQDAVVAGLASHVASFVSWSVLRWHHEREKAIQIVVGVEPLREGQVARSRGAWASEMVRVVRHFGGARFGLMTGPDGPDPDVAGLAGRFANVYASGGWGHGLAPTPIGRDFGRLIQAVPMTKVVGFASDAPYVEWVYGRLQLLRKAMGAALAGLIDARFFEEDEMAPLLRQVLHDTPRALYDLDDA